ncbi:MAG: hypothetical protein H6736_18775 [Alphaproteobacteria bacterium]|nr:hypothetical protein [Alphaproteobacteria bacterium]MCB9693860.1 hypothetical protein [Alphaproteobacteria bacterium]
MSSLTRARLRDNPELAMLVSLAGQLELMEVVFATVHNPDERTAFAEQARSMARVGRVLAHQIRAYADMTEADGPSSRLR